MGDPSSATSKVTLGNARPASFQLVGGRFGADLVMPGVVPFRELAPRVELSPSRS